MFDKIRDILSSLLDVDPDVITPETDIKADLNADSLDIIEIISELEGEFGIMIPQDHLENVSTVAQVCDLVEELQK